MPNDYKIAPLTQRTPDTETAVAWMPRWEGQESDNATFIAHARADVPALLAEVERLRVIEAGCERLCHRWRGSTNPALHMERDLRALLNPTEGEDHE